MLGRIGAATVKGAVEDGLAFYAQLQIVSRLPTLGAAVDVNLGRRGHGKRRVGIDVPVKRLDESGQPRAR